VTVVYNLDQIKSAIDFESLIASQEAGFVAYSEGRVDVPPVGYLGFPEVRGDCHIKYGRILGSDYFVIKVATGFYDNPSLSLSVGSGLMLVFSQRNGRLEGVLLDEGFLTDMRTAVAGAIAAKYLAPKQVQRIGIVGTGVQARMQLDMLKQETDCREAVVWGRDRAKATEYAEEMSAKGFSVEAVDGIRNLAATCNLIVTTTPSREPLLLASDIRPGTHITAVGADAEGKQELDPDIFAKADIVAADSRSQCIDHGDISHGVRSEVIDPTTLIELGELIKNRNLGRTSGNQITVADLTGVAVQDIQIATMVFENLQFKHAKG